MNKLEILKLEEAEIARRGIQNWPVWKKEVSCFLHTYEEDEHCLFIEGEVIIESEGDKMTLHAGDYVIFRNGLKCIWDIRKPVKKYYHFE
jgi:uncharacterized protein